MELLTARPELKERSGITGAELDAQHKRLFDMADELQNAMHQGGGDAILHEHLADLINFTQAHFGAEEQSMRTHDYPGLAPHKCEHDRLLQQIVNLQSQMQAGEQVFSMDVIYFLRYWIMNHVSNSDGAYDTYLGRVEL